MSDPPIDRPPHPPDAFMVLAGLAAPCRLQLLYHLCLVPSATATELATMSNNSRQTTRRHLDALVEMKIVHEEPGETDGHTAGRPATRFSLPSDARASLLPTMTRMLDTLAACAA